MALLPFFAFFTPFFAPMAFSFPSFPILIGGYAAIAVAHVLYEIMHVVHHQPYERCWAPRLERRWSGSAWRWLYGFHQAHHACYRCNLNVAGFFGVPLADLVFGTYARPEPLLLGGTAATTAAARRLSRSRAGRSRGSIGSSSSGAGGWSSARDRTRAGSEVVVLGVRLLPHVLDDTADLRLGTEDVAGGVDRNPFAHDAVGKVRRQCAGTNAVTLPSASEPMRMPLRQPGWTRSVDSESVV